MSLRSVSGKFPRTTAPCDIVSTQSPVRGFWQQQMMSRQFGSSPALHRHLAFATRQPCDRSILPVTRVQSKSGQLSVRYDGGLSALGAGLCAIGAGTSANGLGILFGGYLSALSRNPSISGELNTKFFMGMALIELFGMVTLAMGIGLAFA